MATKENKRSEEEEDSFGLGRKRYGRMVRMFREGFLSVCVYKNVYENRTFFDVVVYRKIRTKDGYDYKRGTNLKPADLPILSKLLSEVQDFVSALNIEENTSQ